MGSKPEIIIVPYFEGKGLSEITSSDIMQWQNEILQMRDEEGKGYSPTYLKTISAQMNAIFNHAGRYYELKENPCRTVGNMGRKKSKEMLFWTVDEYNRFADVMKDKPISYYAFEILFWCGIRMGELMALTVGDLNMESMTLNVNKTYQRINGKEIISEPKTEKGKRTVDLPDFLVEELREYVDKLYGIGKDDRLFPVGKSYLEHELSRGVRLSGVKKIRLHDLRHSHASLLISRLEAPPLLVAQRLGHEKIQTTLDTYSHLYPDQGKDLANRLNALVSDETEEDTEE